MTPQENQTRLTAQLLLIEDPQERLAFIQDRIRKIPPLPEESRTEARRIRGCLTKVWLDSAFDGKNCSFTVDSESSMVRGLASLLGEVYSGCHPAEVAGFASTIVEETGLHRMVTPTRLQGLTQLQDAIRNFARSCDSPDRFTPPC